MVFLRGLVFVAGYVLQYAKRYAKVNANLRWWALIILPMNRGNPMVTIAERGVFLSLDRVLFADF